MDNTFLPLELSDELLEQVVGGTHHAPYHHGPVTNHEKHSGPVAYSSDTQQTLGSSFKGHHVSVTSHASSQANS